MYSKISDLSEKLSSDKSQSQLAEKQKPPQSKKSSRSSPVAESLGLEVQLMVVEAKEESLLQVVFEIHVRDQTRLRPRRQPSPLPLQRDKHMLVHYPDVNCSRSQKHEPSACRRSTVARLPMVRR